MIRVLVVAEVRFYREGLAETLARHPGVAVVGTASGQDDTIAQARAIRPDIILLDTSAPDALRAVRTLTAQVPATKVVAIALAETEHEVLGWAEAGVVGYVPRDASIADLVSAVEATVRGELHCSARMAAGLLRHVGVIARAHGGGGESADPPRLTAREQEVVGLIELGMCNKEIARQLGIGVATAKSHVHHILEKLSVERRSQAAAWLRRRGGIRGAARVAAPGAGRAGSTPPPPSPIVPRSLSETVPVG